MRKLESGHVAPGISSSVNSSAHSYGRPESIVIHLPIPLATYFRNFYLPLLLTGMATEYSKWEAYLSYRTPWV
jgi:hypothetical protein